MAPVNGIVMRGCVEKPSSSLITTMSAHSAALGASCRAIAAVGRLTRRKVLLLQSRTVEAVTPETAWLWGRCCWKRTDTPALAPTATLAKDGGQRQPPEGERKRHACLRVFVASRAAL